MSKSTLQTLKKDGYIVASNNSDVVVEFKDQKELERLLKNFKKYNIPFEKLPQKGYKLKCVLVDLGKRKARCANFTTLLAKKALCVKNFTTKDFISFIAQD